MPFLSDHFTVCSDHPESWRLIDELIYEGKYELFRIPSGFSTDFASVPRAFTWLIPRYGTYTRAAILHDYLCARERVGLFTSADADGIFRRVLRELGVSLPRRWLMWAAVRTRSHMRGATGGDWMRWFVVAALAVLMLLLPVLIVQVWIWLFRLVEWLGGD